MKSFLWLVILLSSCVYSQVNVTFYPQLKGGTAALNKNYIFPNKDTVSISKLRFYISNIELYNNKERVYREKESYHLIDLSKPSSGSISLKNAPKKYTHIEFTLGIDSTTNSGGVLGGDLDPTKGMYWTWKSGYINFKLEGTSSISPNRKNKFTLHLGGYSGVQNAAQVIRLLRKNPTSVDIQFDLASLFNKLDFSTQKDIMMPGEEAVKMSRTITSLFSIIP
jgi:hypothetical protein